MIAALWAVVVMTLLAGRTPAGKSADCVKEAVLPHLFAAMKQSVQNGGYVLLASSITPLQHDRVSRILLTRGTGHLFTHEFTRSAKSKGKG